MLVLTRHLNEVIRIGHDITITVLDVKGDKARLGIDAPRDITVYREELYQAIQRQNLVVAATNAADPMSA